MKLILTFFKVSTLSISLLGATAVVSTLLVPDVAYAGNGNDKGKGSEKSSNAKSDKAGKGSERGKSGSNARNDRTAGGKDKRAKSNGGKSNFSLKSLFGKDNKSATRTKTTNRKGATRQAPAVTSAPAPKPKGNRLAATLGVHPSELGALNAANASPNALANASPNSRVGKIAIYAEMVRATAELRDELSLAQEELDLLEEPMRNIEEIDGEIVATTEERNALEGELAALEQSLADAGGVDETIQAEIQSVQDQLGANEDRASELEQERMAAEDFLAAQEEVTRLETEIESQQGSQRAALEDAANKEVTDQVELAVQSILGLGDVGGSD